MDRNVVLQELVQEKLRNENWVMAEVSPWSSQFKGMIAWFMRHTYLVIQMTQNAFLRHIWSSSTIPKNFQSHRAKLVIFRHPPTPKRWIVARRANRVIKDWNFQSPTPHPDLQGGERGWRLNQPKANNLAYHDYIMNPPYKTQENIFLVLLGELP